MSAALRPRVRRRPSSLQRLRTLPLPFLAEPEAGDEGSEVAVEPLPAASSAAAAQQASVAAAQQISAAAPEQISAAAAQQASVAAPQVSAAAAQQALMARLTREVQRIEVSGRMAPARSCPAKRVFSTGCGEMDRCLPGGGYEAGTVVEYLQTSMTSGATSLALSAAREALAAASDRFCVLVDWCQQFYPPAAAALGIDLKRLVIVRPRTLAERLWAIDQALRSPAIAAVIAEIEQMDDRAARRLQLAAERGGGVGLLVRRAAARQHPSWAEVQWLVRPLADSSAHRQLKLELMRVRGGRSGTSVRVQINAHHGRVEAAPAAVAVLARSLAQPRTQVAARQGRSA